MYTGCRICNSKKNYNVPMHKNIGEMVSEDSKKELFTAVEKSVKLYAETMSFFQEEA